MDPITREKSVSSVDVAHAAKPMVCNGCKSLGHLISACPVTIRKWVQKNPIPVTDESN